MTTWREAQQGDDSDAGTRIGGQPSWQGAPCWPSKDDELLPFLGQIRFEQTLLLIFMSEDPSDDPWSAEDGANAVLVEPDGDYPSWVERTSSAVGPSWLPDAMWVPKAPLEFGGVPEWMQQDETPDAAPDFVCMLRGFPDLEDILAFGADGDAYLFVSRDRRTARILWQS
jgi:hypothetical protein